MFYSLGFEKQPYLACLCDFSSQEEGGNSFEVDEEDTSPSHEQV